MTDPTNLIDEPEDGDGRDIKTAVLVGLIIAVVTVAAYLATL